MNKLKLNNQIKDRIKEEKDKENPDVELLKELYRDLMLHGIGLDNLNIVGKFKIKP